MTADVPQAATDAAGREEAFNDWLMNIADADPDDHQAFCAGWDAAAPLIAARAAAAERDRIRQLAIAEADRLRAGNFGPRAANVKALCDFADLLEDGHG